MTDEEEARTPIPFLDRLIGRVGQLPIYHPRRFGVGAPEDLREDGERRHQRILGEIEDLLSAGWEVLRDLWNEANPDASPRWDDEWTPTCLAIYVWADDTDRYDLQRYRLEEFLQTLRSDCDRIDQERIDRICYGDRLPASRYAWEDLSARQRKCIQHLLTLERGEKRSEKELAVMFNSKPGSLKRELADLVKKHILVNKPGEGYWVRKLPGGTPHRIANGIE